MVDELDVVVAAVVVLAGVVVVSDVVLAGAVVVLAGAELSLPMFGQDAA